MYFISALFSYSSSLNRPNRQPFFVVRMTIATIRRAPLRRSTIFLNGKTGDRERVLLADNATLTLYMTQFLKLTSSALLSEQFFDVLAQFHVSHLSNEINSLLSIAFCRSMSHRLFDSPDPKRLQKECTVCRRTLGKNDFTNVEWTKGYARCKECVPGGFVAESTNAPNQSQLDLFSNRVHPAAQDESFSLSSSRQDSAPKLSEKNFCIDRSRNSWVYEQVPPRPLQKENVQGYQKGSNASCGILCLRFLSVKTSPCLAGTYISVNMANNDIHPGYHLHHVKGTDFFTLMRNGDTGMFLVACSIFSGDGLAYEHYIAYDGWRGLLYEPLNNDLVALEEKDVASGKAGITEFVRIRDALKIKHFGGVYQLWKKK